MANEVTLNLTDVVVAMAAQDFDAMVKVAEYPAETLMYWFTYGVRRAYQDGINATAHKLKGEGQVLSGQKLFEGRDKVFRDATMRMRGAGGDDPLVTEAKSKLREVVKAGDAKKYKDSSPDERDAMVDAAWAALPDAHRESYMRAATASMARKIAERAEKAREAEELKALGLGVTI